MEAPEALIVVSFGGPEGPGDVMPFLHNVVKGKNVSHERLQAVAQHYYLFGGVSPINDQNRKLIAALRAELDRHGIDIPIYWGNRNWHPLLEDTIAAMAADGIKRAVAFVTSPYSSYSSCRQYLEDIERARAAVGARAPIIEKIGPYYAQPGFIQANVERLKDTLVQLSAQEQAEIHVAFSAHSIPLTMARGCLYEKQLEFVADTVAQRCGIVDWSLVYQSRSGPPTQPWLEPDIGDHLRALKRRGTKHVIVAPIGFISDHMEVIYDLDTEAWLLCHDILRINMMRSPTVGTHPSFIAMIRQLLQEELRPGNDNEDRQYQEATSFCSPTCCPRTTAEPEGRECGRTC